MEKKKDTSHFVYGIIIALIMIVFFITVLLTRLWEMYFLVLGISILIFILGIIFACIQFSKIEKGNIIFGDLFAKGFKTAMLAALILIVWSLLQPIIFSNMQGEIIAYTTNFMRQKGADNAAINRTIESIKYPNYTLEIAQKIFGYAIMGAVASLLGAAIAKKNPQANNPFEQ